MHDTRPPKKTVKNLPMQEEKLTMDIARVVGWQRARRVFCAWLDNTRVLTHCLLHFEAMLTQHMT